MGNLKLGHKKAILIGAGLLLLVLTFFLIFQRNQETLMQVEMESMKAQNQVNFLSTLQIKVNSMRDTMPEVQKETEEYLKSFPSLVTQQKAIYNVYKMMVDSGIRVTAIKPGNEVTYFEGGEIINSDENGQDNGSEDSGGQAENESPSAVEQAPEQRADTLSDMVGKYTAYEVDLTGSRKQIMKAIEWVAENEEKMNVTAVNLTFDSSTGKLTGTMQINYFYMNGNGVPYEEPDISGITFGTENIYGTFDKKKKK